MDNMPQDPINQAVETLKETYNGQVDLIDSLEGELFSEEVTSPRLFMADDTSIDNVEESDDYIEKGVDLEENETNDDMDDEADGETDDDTADDEVDDDTADDDESDDETDDDTTDDDESGDETDDDDDDDDDDDNPPSGFEGEEDENQLIQLEKKQETTLKDPLFNQKQVEAKKPLRETPKGPEKTERSPWQQMMDFFIHGAKGAMIKNGDISTKASIVDKFLIGLGFKSFKEDVLIQEHAKKYWMQKSQGLKADNSLLNTDRIKTLLKKEDKLERIPFIKEARAIKNKIEELIKQRSTEKNEKQQVKEFIKEKPIIKQEVSEKKEQLTKQENFSSPKALSQQNEEGKPHLTAKFEEAKIKTEIPTKTPEGNLLKKQETNVANEQIATVKEVHKDQAFQQHPAAEEIKKNSLEKNLEKAGSAAAVLAIKTETEEKRQKEVVTNNAKREKQDYDNAFINQQIQAQNAQAMMSRSSQNLINEQLAMITAMRMGLNHAPVMTGGHHHHMHRHSETRIDSDTNHIIDTNTPSGLEKAAQAFTAGWEKGVEQSGKTVTPPETPNNHPSTGAMSTWNHVPDPEEDLGKLNQINTKELGQGHN